MLWGLSSLVLQAGRVQDGDALAGESDQVPVGVVAQHFGAGLAGSASQGCELLVGEGAYLRAARGCRPQGDFSAINRA